MSVWTIELCDGFVKVGEVESFSQFNAVIHDLEIGGFRLEAAEVGLSGADLALVDSIVVRRDTTIMFAGLVRPAGTGAGGTTVTASNEGRRVVLDGVDLWGVLAARVAFPDPTTLPPWGLSHDVRTGVASTVAADYITANVGAGALTARQVPGLTVNDSGVGTTGTWSARLQPLDQLVARVCADGGITCYPTLMNTGTIVVRLSGTADLSGSLILSDQGDLTDTVWLRRPNSGDWVLAAGQGVLTARAFATPTLVTSTGLDRVEVLYDNTNITTGTELQQAANTQQTERSPSTTVSTRLAVGASQRFEFLTDYNVGDLVAVELKNVRYTVPVRSVAIELSPGVAVVSPTLGVATPDRLTGLTDDVDGLAQRLDRQIA